MYNPGVNQIGQTGLQELRRTTMWTRFREQLTFANIVGIVGAICALLCLLFLPSASYWNIRLPLYLILVVWTLLRPRIALYLLPVAIPWGSLDTITVSSLNANSADILVFLLILSWLGSYVLRTYGLIEEGPLDFEKKALPRYLIIAAIVMFAAMLLSTVTALSVKASIKDLIKWIEFLAVLFIGAMYLRTRKQIWLLIVIMLLAGISQAFYGYAQNFLNLGPQSFIRNGGLRVYGTFNQPNPYAGYINMLLPIAISLMLLGRNWATRLLASIAAILLGAAEYLTKSNGGEIAITVSVLFILLVGFPSLRKPAAVCGFGVLLVIAALLAGIIPERLTNPLLRKLGLVSISFTSPSAQDYSTAERLAHWIAGIRMFLDRPFTGVGIGNYGTAYAPYHVTIFVNSLDHAHNYYINTAAETGIIGLVTFLFFLYAMFLAGRRSFLALNKKYQDLKKAQSMPKVGASRLVMLHASNLLGIFTNDRALAIGLLAAIISVCVHNFVDDLYVHALTMLFALLIIALVRLAAIHFTIEKKEMVD